MTILMTERLELVPITLPLVEAVLTDRVDEVARIARARLPEKWPGRALVERAFSAQLDRIRDRPDVRLWGDRLMCARDGDGTRRIVGSVVFHGAPDDEGVVEIAYGVEPSSQGMGYGSEATTAMVEWALSQRDVRAVSATTFPWHAVSVKILQRAGLRHVGWRDHEMLGEMQVYERRRDEAVARSYRELAVAASF